MRHQNGTKRVVSFSKPTVTFDEVTRAVPHGALSKKQARAWGIPWPLKAGWKHDLPGAPHRSKVPTMPDDAAERFARGATAVEIEAARSARGGFTAASLSRFGIAWPPPAGWRSQLVANAQRASDRRPAREV